MIELLYGFWSFATSRIGSLVCVGVACLAIGWSTGKEGERKRGEAATLRNQIAAIKMDADADKAAKAVAEKIATGLQSEDAKNQGVISGWQSKFEAEQAKAAAAEAKARAAAAKAGKPIIVAAGPCNADGSRLSRDEFERLRAIR